MDGSYPASPSTETAGPLVVVARADGIAGGLFLMALDGSSPEPLLQLGAEISLDAPDWQPLPVPSPPPPPPPVPVTPTFTG